MRRLRKEISIDVNETFEVDVTLSMDEIKSFFDECSDEEKQNVDESNIYDVKILTVEEINEFKKKLKQEYEPN